MLSLVPAGPADVDALIAIDHMAAISAERRADIAGWVAAGQCHVARRDAEVVGYAALTRGFFHSAFVEMLMVAPAARRTGIGRALLEHCIALTPPGEKLWTSTNESNAPMRRLLPQLGFVQAGTVEHLDPGDPELIFLRWPAGADPG